MNLTLCVHGMRTVTAIFSHLTISCKVPETTFKISKKSLKLHLKFPKKSLKLHLEFPKKSLKLHLKFLKLPKYYILNLSKGSDRVLRSKDQHGCIKSVKGIPFFSQHPLVSGLEYMGSTCSGSSSI